MLNRSVANFTFLCLLVLASLSQTTHAQANHTWFVHGDSEYALTSTRQAWSLNEAEAVSQGGHLVTINSAEENAWLVDTFPNVYCIGFDGNGGGALAQIGYFRDVDNNWKWISGEGSTYTNLYSMFPQGGHRSYMHLAPFTGVGRGQWNANPAHTEPGGGNLAYGIIERQKGVRPNTILSTGGIRMYGIAGFGESMASKAPVVAAAAGYTNTVALRKDGTVVAWGANSFGQSSVPLGLTGVVQVSSSYMHVLALKSNGTVVAWGENTYGECDVPAGLSNVIQVAAGGQYSLALKSDGTIVGWGRNDYGVCTIPASVQGIATQISAGAMYAIAIVDDGAGPYAPGTVKLWGNGSGQGEINMPSGLSGVKQISAGRFHGLALKTDGSVVAWGLNAQGQTNVPAGLSGVEQLIGGGEHSLALKTNGSIVGWGYDYYGQIAGVNGKTGVLAVAAGGYHSVLVRDDGEVIAKGNNGYQQCNVPAGPVPLRSFAMSYLHGLGISNSGSAVGWGNNTNGQCNIPSDLGPVTQVAVGSNHSIALTAAGTVRAWANYQQVGELNVPAGLADVVQVHTSWAHNLALKRDGTVVAWGLNDRGQSNVPAGLTQVTQVSAGIGHSLALLGNGSVVAWGDNSKGQITPPAGLTGVIQVAAGGDTSAALKSNGTIVVWGEVADGQGNVPGYSNFVQVSVGLGTIIGLKSDGTVACWGKNDAGQTAVPLGLSRVKEVCAAGISCMALLQSGEVVGWGGSGYGEANGPAGSNFIGAGNIAGGFFHIAALNGGRVNAWGDDSAGQATAPPLPPVFSISAGAYHTLGLLSGGSAIGWGRNAEGQAGAHSSYVKVVAGPYHSVGIYANGTIGIWGANGHGQHNQPLGLNNVVQVAAGQFSNIALKSDGTLVGWGTNTQGELSIPAGLTGVQQIVGGVHHYAALKSDGTVVAWGYNAEGQCNVPAGLTNAVYIAAGPKNTIAVTATGQIHVWGSSAEGVMVRSSEILKPAQVKSGYDYVAVLPSLSLTVEPYWAYEGTQISGKVYLVNAAPAGGIYVTLSSLDSDISVPSSVFVEGGSRTATFPITVQYGAGASYALIQASSDGATSYGTVMTLEAPNSLTDLTLSSNAVTGGTNVTGTVTLEKASTFALTVSLASDNAAATVPATVTVPAGQTQGTFTVSTSGVASATTATISAIWGGTTKSASLTINRPSLVSVVLPDMFGMQKKTGTITLNGPAPANFSVALSSNKAVLSVPSSVAFTAGQSSATFIATSGEPAGQITATVSASVNGGTVTDSVFVKPNSITLLKLAPITVVGGSSTNVTGTVTISGAPYQAVSATLSVSVAGGAASVPGSVSIAANATTGTFVVTHNRVQGSTIATVTATKGVAKTATLTLNPNPIVSFTLNAASVFGASTKVITGKVTLTSAVKVDTQIPVSSDLSSAAEVPAFVTIPAGLKVGSFEVIHKDVTAKKVANLSVGEAGEVVALPLTVNPNHVASLVLSPSSVIGGSSTVVTGTVTLKAAVKADTVVTLMSTAPEVAGVPMTVVVPAGASFVTFTVTHALVDERWYVAIAASRPGKSHAVLFFVDP